MSANAERQRANPTRPTDGSHPANDSDAHEAGVSAGLEWAVSSSLSVSGTVVAAWSNGGPGAGLLLGFAPSFQLWR